jgi:hypothetical protein
MNFRESGDSDGTDNHHYNDLGQKVVWYQVVENRIDLCEAQSWLSKMNCPDVCPAVGRRLLWHWLPWVYHFRCFADILRRSRLEEYILVESVEFTLLQMGSST